MKYVVLVGGLAFVAACAGDGSSGGARDGVERISGTRTCCGSTARPEPIRPERTRTANNTGGPSGARAQASGTAYRTERERRATWPGGTRSRRRRRTQTARRVRVPAVGSCWDAMGNPADLAACPLLAARANLYHVRRRDADRQAALMRASLASSDRAAMPDSTAATAASSAAGLVHRSYGQHRTRNPCSVLSGQW